MKDQLDATVRNDCVRRTGRYTVEQPEAIHKRPEPGRGRIFDVSHAREDADCCTENGLAPRGTDTIGTPEPMTRAA
jgi:hypothetical protein